MESNSYAGIIMYECWLQGQIGKCVEKYSNNESQDKISI